MVVDAHLHLWDTGRLRYEWLQRPGNAAINRTFGFEDFRVRAAAAGVDRAVLVQADDSAADTEAMFEVAAAHPEIAGVVGWVPLDRPDEAAAQLTRLQARPGFAGIRNLIHDQPDPDWLLRPEVGQGLALLERGGVPFDVISVLPRHLSHVPVLSEGQVVGAKHLGGIVKENIVCSNGYRHLERVYIVHNRYQTTTKRGRVDLCTRQEENSK